MSKTPFAAGEKKREILMRISSMPRHK
jgi:hypothetical protein